MSIPKSLSLLANVRTDFFSFISSELAWRFPLGFQIFFGIIILAFAYWLPESPRWLISKHRDGEAMANMSALEGDNEATISASVMQEFNKIKGSIAAEQSTVVKRKTMPRWRLLLGVGAQAMQQLTGINIICYYLPYVLVESVGQNGSTARVVAAVNALSYLGATLIGLHYIDKWGRRRLMWIGATGQGLCWLTITLLLSYADKAAVNYAGAANDAPEPSAHGSPMTKILGSASVAFFFLFNVFFGAGWQGVSWLYPTEINSTQNRILGMSLGVATNWAINFAVVFVTPLGIAKLKAQFYIIWTILNFIIAPIVYFFYPETSGRSLEAIDTLFENNNTIWAGLHPDMYKMKRISRVPSHHNDSENGTTSIHLETLAPRNDVTVKAEPTLQGSAKDAPAPPPSASAGSTPSSSSTPDDPTADSIIVPVVFSGSTTPTGPSASSSSEHVRPRTNTHDSHQRANYRLQTIPTADSSAELGRETSTLPFIR